MLFLTHSIPRTSGGGSYVGRTGEKPVVYSPHKWGWLVEDRLAALGDMGIPRTSGGGSFAFFAAKIA